MQNITFSLSSPTTLGRWLLLLTVLTTSLLKSPAQTFTGLTLVNATTDADIRPLLTRDTLNLAQTGVLLNIRANPSPEGMGSVVFALDSNAMYRIENLAPYFLQGDIGGKPNPWTPTVGTHLITATPFSARGGSGTKGKEVGITLVVINQPIDTTGTPVDTTATDSITVSGELKKWHKITLSLQGPPTNEQATNNAFLNYRLNVTFSNGQQSYLVPGYFAADGQAAQSGATAGKVWRVHFAPDATGKWTYLVSFRSGPNLAVSDEANAGNPVAGLDGLSGSFNVGPTDKAGRDHRGKGRLRYVGGHYLQYAETGEYFVKGGVDAPENLLDYEDFDNTPNVGGRRKSWAPHLPDWHSGDTTWQGGKGKGLIGALNYLSEQGLNAFSFIPFTIQGDDRNVYPYVSDTDFTRLDCSKLDQWEIVFDHADKKGLYLHFKTQEIENCKVLDGGAVGLQRKLYYRELIARFGHHLALNWNLGEENIQTEQQRKDMAQYFFDHDPYRHLIVLHTLTGQQDAVYTNLLGNNSQLTGVSLQVDKEKVYSETRKWVLKSDNAAKAWVVANDEQGKQNDGVSCDADYPGNRGTVADNQEQVRREVLWGNLMAGGGGVEYYFGYQTGQTDLSLQDFRSRAKMFGFTRQALDFFRTYLPFQEMAPMDNVASTGWVLGKAGELYAVYLQSGDSATLKLDTEGTYAVQWYDPRNGGSLQSGSVSSISGSGLKSIGSPPAPSSQDWVALIIRRAGQQVVSFTLVNADTALDLQTISNGTSLNLAALPTTHFNIRANTSPVTVGSVVFQLTGQQIRTVTKDGAPYSLFGDVKGNDNTWVPAVGSYTLTATPFSAGAGGGTAGTALTINFTVVNQLDTNQAPVVSNPIPDQTATVGTIYRFRFPANTFTDPAGKPLTYSANLSNNDYLPSWLTFTAATRSFSGTPPSDSLSPLRIQLTANDGQRMTSTTFSITIQPATTATPLFLINAGGPALTTGGKNWSADQFFDMGDLFSNPTLDSVANTTDDGLYYSERYRVQFSYNIPVPAAGTYTVKLHFAEIYFIGALAGTGKRVFNVSVEGEPVLTNFDINAEAGPGPAALIKSFTTPVTDGKLTIAFTSVVDNAKLSALEVYQVSNQTARIAPEERPVANPVLVAYPNPLPDGRFAVALSQAVQGPVSYVLATQSGRLLGRGQLAFNEPVSLLPFDLSPLMGSAGVYYLRLEGENWKAFIKLERQ